MIEYRGYRGAFEYDPEAEVFHGRVLGIRDVITFEGHSVEELKTAMAESVEDYLAFCRELDREPERPYRGAFLVRTSPELHREAAVRAEAEGMSLNAWVEAAIREALARPQGRTPVRGTQCRGSAAPRG